MPARTRSAMLRSARATMPPITRIFSYSAFDLIDTAFIVREAAMAMATNCGISLVVYRLYPVSYLERTLLVGPFLVPDQAAGFPKPASQRMSGQAANPLRSESSESRAGRTRPRTGDRTTRSALLSPH